MAEAGSVLERVSPLLLNDDFIKLNEIYGVLRKELSQQELLHDHVNLLRKGIEIRERERMTSTYRCYGLHSKFHCLRRALKYNRAGRPRLFKTHIFA